MPDLLQIGILAGILLSAALGALPPLLGRWNNRQLHLFVAFGAGVFLGAVFFHLVPEALADQPGNLVNFMILNGFMVVLFVERVLVRHCEGDCDDELEHRHHIVSMSAFVGLSIHSLMSGLALGASFVAPKIALVIFLAIVAHKSVAAFSLASVFKLSGIPTGQALRWLTIFALSTPLGALVAMPLAPMLGARSLAITTALAAGTFIYVATMDLLPEAFHDGRERLRTFIALSLGILIMLGISLAD